MQKLTSKFVRKNCYFILYDYPNDDKFIFYFDNIDELSKLLNYPCNYLVYQFNTYVDAIVCVFKQVKYYLHIFIDEELAVQKS